MKRTLTTLSGSWTLYILMVLYKHGPSRFKDLENKVEGISPRMLTERLKMLEKTEIITRQRVASPSPRVTYQLTSKGEKMSSVLEELDSLAQEWEAA